MTSIVAHCSDETAGETWWRAQGRLTVRDVPDSVAEHVADFLPDDAVRGFGVPDGDWQRVDLEGAVKFDRGDDTLASQDVPNASFCSTKLGFVRVRNRFRELLLRAPDEAAAVESWAQQIHDRPSAMCWFRPPPRSAATAAQYERPLLAGGREEFERRWEIQSVVTEIIAAQPSLRNYGPNQLKTALRARFGDTDWLEPLLAQKGVVASLFSTAISELKPTVKEVAPIRKFSGKQGTVQADDVEAIGSSVAVLPDITQPILHVASPQRVSIELGPDIRAVASSNSASSFSVASTQCPVLNPLLADVGHFTELLARLPWSDYPSFAAAGRPVAAAVRGANWQRLSEVLADEHGLLVPRLNQRHLAGPGTAAEWRAFFAYLWERRWKWCDVNSANGFRVRTLVRFRPGAISNVNGVSQLFLPLHQRLQLVRLGHDTSFRDQVAKRMGASGDVTVDAPIRTKQNTLGEDEDLQFVAGSSSEEVHVNARVISTEETRVLVSLPGMGLRYFDFERVLDGRHGQGDVYSSTALPAVEAFLEGFNACILCYGQTGSGKTHTMFGAEGCLDADAAGAEFQNGLSAHAGIVPRALVDVLAAVEARAHQVSATITLSYVEIYNDQLTDLLSGEDVTLFRIGQGVAASEYRAAAEVGEEALYELQGARIVEVDSIAEALRTLAEGEKFKHRAATALNARSSRAHAVLMLGLTQRFDGHVLRSRLHLVDLGGSEQVKKSQAEGQRFAEAVEINSSLMVLGRVVDALIQRRSHIPYYESKLTMLLQPALGGNARTTVVVAASPEDVHADETVHALRFGERCACLTNDARITTASMSEVLQSLELNIADCEKELAELEAHGAAERALAELGDGHLRGLGFGHGRSRLVARSHDDGTSGREAALSTQQCRESISAYTVVEDAAGQWLAQNERLQTLLQRKREILGR